MMQVGSACNTSSLPSNVGTPFLVTSGAGRWRDYTSSAAAFCGLLMIYKLSGSLGLWFSSYYMLTPHGMMENTPLTGLQRLADGYCTGSETSAS